MKKLSFTCLCLALICCTTSCKSSKKTTGINPQISTVSIYQNNKEIGLDNEIQEVSINKESFSIRYYHKRYNADKKEFYAAQIAALLQKSDFDQIKTGMATSETECFEPGTGMAASRSGGYTSLIFNNAGHHYLIYESPEENRVNLLGEAGDYLKLEFPVNSLYYEGKEVAITETELDEFYLVIFIDRNLDNQIDKGELNKVIVKLK